jgi:carboxymethylenebutenolidase
MRIELPSGCPAELCEPVSGEPTRGVVIEPDIWGLRPLFDDLARKLCDENNWSVCVVEPFPGESLGGDIESRRLAVGTKSDDEQLGNLILAADRLGVEPVAVMGFCMGGMYALKAVGTRRFDRAVSFYGMITLPDYWQTEGHGEPLDAIRRNEDTKVLAILGEADEYTPPADIEALRLAGPHIATVSYPDAQHGFVHDASRPTHRADDAADAWRRAIAFLS